jgi:UDP-glucose 4-epimerase
MFNILITGGLGYIGSHIIIELGRLNYNIDIVDNCVNSDINTFNVIKQILANNNYNGIINLYTLDLINLDNIELLFLKHKYNAVIHLAGFKSITESIKDPLKYYNNNLISTINLLQMMKKYQCHKLIFSSSASVYGKHNKGSDETTQLGNGITNPYSRSKYFIEEMLTDLQSSSSIWQIISLRYYNPIGSHSSGLLGDSPKSLFTNLMPYISDVLLNKTKCLYIYGNTYNTADGTCVRDYIHVEDLAVAHINSLQYILENNNSFMQSYNVGIGKGYSVLDIIKMMEFVSKKKINYIFTNERVGDIDEIYANSKLIQHELLWTPKYNLYDMCLSHWNFLQKKIN